MNENIVEIIKPGIYLNLNSYWAMHYCSILEVLYDQKTMAHSFNREYMVNVEPTLGNLAAKAGFAFLMKLKTLYRTLAFKRCYATTLQAKKVDLYLKI